MCSEVIRIFEYWCYPICSFQKRRREMREDPSGLAGGLAIGGKQFVMVIKVIFEFELTIGNLQFWSFSGLILDLPIKTLPFSNLVLYGARRFPGATSRVYWWELIQMWFNSNYRWYYIFLSGIGFRCFWSCYQAVSRYIQHSIWLIYNFFVLICLVSNNLPRVA